MKTRLHHQHKEEGQDNGVKNFLGNEESSIGKKFTVVLEISIKRFIILLNLFNTLRTRIIRYFTHRCQGIFTIISIL